MLEGFLTEARRLPFDWKRCNCLTFCADWIVLLTGRDPAARFRHIKSKAQARKVTRQAGGDVALVESAMRTFGAQETATPELGDFALVEAPVSAKGGVVRHRAIGAICLGGSPARYAVLTADIGLVTAPMRMLKAWSIDHG